MTGPCTINFQTNKPLQVLFFFSPKTPLNFQSGSNHHYLMETQTNVSVVLHGRRYGHVTHAKLVLANMASTWVSYWQPKNTKKQIKLHHQPFLPANLRLNDVRKRCNFAFSSLLKSESSHKSEAFIGVLVLNNIDTSDWFH